MSSKFIKDLYKSCKALQLVKTQEEFSTKICGKSRKWYSSVVSTNYAASTDSLVRAYKNIEALAQKQENLYIKSSFLNLSIEVKNHIDNKLTLSPSQVQVVDVSTKLENQQDKFNVIIKKFKNMAKNNIDLEDDYLLTIHEILETNTAFLEVLEESLKELE
jgi:K+-transporting ATPase c subunit